MTYIPASKKTLDGMNLTELMDQYHGLVGWIEEYKGNGAVNFERYPKASADTLRELISKGQEPYLDNMLMFGLADGLEAFGKTHPDAVIYIE